MVTTEILVTNLAKVSWTAQLHTSSAMEVPEDYSSKHLSYAAKKKQSSNNIPLKVAVAISLCIALVSLAFALIVYFNVNALKMKVEKCATVGRATREKTDMVDNEELKALNGEIAEIRAKISELILNASITYSELKSIIYGIQEEITVVRKAQGKLSYVYS